MPTPLQNFVPSADELNLSSRLLEANTSSWNRSDTLSVDTAIGIFKQSGVSFKQLRDIWSVADKDGSGKLSKEELAVVIRLTGWVQAGEALDEKLLEKVGPLPKLKRFSNAVVTKVYAPFPSITNDDVIKFKQKFLELGPVNRAIQRRKVMEVYMSLKPDLSFEELYKIMQLVDKKSRVCDFKSFALGMHIVESLLSSMITSVPSSVLPEDCQILDKTHIEYPTFTQERDTELSNLFQHQIQSSNFDLPAKIDADIRDLMKDVEQHQHISGHMTLKFLSEYRIRPTEMALIWHQSNVDFRHQLTPARMKLIEQLIRQRLAKKLSGIERPPRLRPSSVIHSHSTKPLTGDSFRSSATAQTPVPSKLSESPIRALFSTEHLPVLPTVHPMISKSTSSDSSTAQHDDFLQQFKEEVGRLTSQLEVVILDQTGTQNELRRNVEILQHENHQLKQREHTLQNQLVRKEEDCDKVKKLMDSMKLELLEQQVISKEYQDAGININNEAERLWGTVDTQSSQITTLLDLVADLKATITELHIKPEQHDLRLQFLRASAREAEAAATKATEEAKELRQTVHKLEGELVQLRGNLEDVECRQPLSQTNKDMLGLRNDHKIWKTLMENMQRLMEQHLMSLSDRTGTSGNDDTMPAKKAHRHESTFSIRGGPSRTLYPIATEMEDQSYFTDLPPPFSSSSAHQPLPQYAPRASTPCAKLDPPHWTSRETSTVFSINLSSHPPEKVSNVDRSPDPPLHNPQFEDDLQLFKLNVQRKGYIGIEMIQRFISNYDIEAFSLDKIGRLVGLDAGTKRIDHAVIRPHSIDNKLLSASLPRSSSGPSSSSKIISSLLVQADNSDKHCRTSSLQFILSSNSNPIATQSSQPKRIS